MFAVWVQWSSSSIGQHGNRALKVKFLLRLIDTRFKNNRFFKTGKVSVFSVNKILFSFNLDMNLHLVYRFFLYQFFHSPTLDIMSGITFNPAQKKRF